MLEDDCLPVDGFAAEFGRLTRTLPPDFDVALLGYTASDVVGDHLITAAVAPVMKRRPTRKVNDDWRVPGIFIGAHCYLVSPLGAKKLLEDKTIFHADAVICRNTNLNLYCARQPIATQQMRGIVRYNSQLSWEWMLGEPLGALGDATIRIRHIVVMYAVIVAVGATKGLLIPIVDLLLLATLVRALIIAASVPMPDPSGVCEEKSLRRYSIFENCGSLLVSGHIMPAVILAYLTPNVGLPLVILQATLILSSRSHYPGDVVLGIAVVSAMLWLFQKNKLLPSSRKKYINK